MRALVIVDSLAKMVPYKDTSLDLMVTGAARGHEIWAAEGTGGISSGSEGPFARLVPMRFETDPRGTKTFDLAAHAGEGQRRPIAEMDAVFIRNDPPFEQNYFSLTLLLSAVEERAIFVNPPKALRHISEKISTTLFPHLMPRTVISADAGIVMDFIREHGRAVLKPCFEGAGRGVRLAKDAGPETEKTVHEMLTTGPGGPIIAQEFLPEITEGDTRVMVVDGEIVGAIGRKPNEGDFRANLAAGGSAFAVELSDAQRKGASEVAAHLKREGIVFAGLDFIGGRLIEINVTSPTLVQELRRESGIDVSTRVWEAVEARRG